LVLGNSVDVVVGIGRSEGTSGPTAGTRQDSPNIETSAEPWRRRET